MWVRVYLENSFIAILVKNKLKSFRSWWIYRAFTSSVNVVLPFHCEKHAAKSFKRDGRRRTKQNFVCFYIVRAVKKKCMKETNVLLWFIYTLHHFTIFVYTKPMNFSMFSRMLIYRMKNLTFNDCISILDVKQTIKTPITIDKLISITTKKQIFYREKLINTWLFQICD